MCHACDVADLIHSHFLESVLQCFEVLNVLVFQTRGELDLLQYNTACMESMRKQLFPLAYVVCL